MQVRGTYTTPGSARPSARGRDQAAMYWNLYLMSKRRRHCLKSILQVQPKLLMQTIKRHQHALMSLGVMSWPGLRAATRRAATTHLAATMNPGLLASTATSRGRARLRRGGGSL
uniref:Uncharacterized protein n=1 Tax=Triticum urartu TaxID=4572 RepID=A0A8R7VF53_TRIUA